MSVSEDQINALNEKLDDLQISGTSRFTREDFSGEAGQTVLQTCSRLIDKIRCYDNSVPVLPRHPSWHEITAALSVKYHLPLDQYNGGIFGWLELICVQLQAERLLYHRTNSCPDVESSGVSDKISVGIASETIPCTENDKLIFQLHRICRGFNIEESALELSAADMCRALVGHITTVIEQAPPSVISNPPKVLEGEVSVQLSETQRTLLRDINQAFVQDFSLRRKMLLTRVDVTLQSFLWGDKAVGRVDEIKAAVQSQQRHMRESPVVYEIEDAISAPKSLLQFHSKRVTGSSNYATANDSVVKKVSIGLVPDRGGRPKDEARLKATIAKDDKHRGGRGRGGRGGGNRDGGGGRGGRKNGDLHMNNASAISLTEGESGESPVDRTIRKRAGSAGSTGGGGSSRNPHHAKKKGRTVTIE